MGKGTFEDAYAAAQKAGSVERVDVKMVQWNEAGEALIGEFVLHEPFTGGDFDTPVERYFFNADFGRCSCLLGSATDKQLADTLKPGDLLRIEFQGKKEIGGGRSVNQFKIEIFGHAKEKP